MDPRLPKRLDAMFRAFRAGNPGDLKRIGYDAIGDAALQNDHDLASLSVIAYSLYKIITRAHFMENPRWQWVSETISSSLERSFGAAERLDHKGFHKNMKSIIGKIQGIDNELSNYARNVYEKAKIKQASTAYAMGLSLKQAAELTQADPKELQKYIGITRIHDEQPGGIGISERLRAFKEALGK